MPYVYIVECRDGTFYTGYAEDVRKRIAEHNRGHGAKYTRGRGPVRLRYVELCLDKPSGLRRERAIKQLDKWNKQALIESVCLLTGGEGTCCNGS